LDETIVSRRRIMPLYEVNLQIENIHTTSKISYYERWLINEIPRPQYFEPILEKVFPRDRLPFKMMPEEALAHWVVLLNYPSDQKDTAFKLGMKLIQEFVGGELLSGKVIL
jgi:hypothetical protein